MNAYFAGKDYVTHDRTDFPKESVLFENVWGVADEVLFGNALSLLDKAGNNGKRFFMHIMTTSNHRPFTYPDGRIDIPSPGGRDGAVKYTDFAIGQFIEQARKHPWFDDKLFVIIADHCAAVSGKTELPVAKYHIPLILYGPEIVRPGHFPRMISQLDVPPTLFDILGLEGDDEYFFGTAEMTAGDSGIGYLMQTAGSQQRMPLAFAGLVTIGAMAMAMYELFSWIEMRTTAWAHRGSQAA